MPRERDDDDDAVLDTLREHAERVERLEREIHELERERATWRDSQRRMSHELEELTKVRAEWEWFFNHSLEMLCIAGVDGYFRRVNPAFARTLGYEQHELVSQPFSAFIHPDDIAATNEALEALASSQDCVNFENRYRHRDGSWRWISWHCPALSPTTTKLYAIARDITDRKRMDFELLYRASHDSLTNLLNRAAFEDGLATAIQRVKRNAGSQLALYVVDLDGFKAINDTYGHPAGDAALQELARRMSRVHRQGELVCRIGGDEFAFLIESSGPLVLEPLARRIVDTLSQPITLDVATVSVGCSIGIAVCPQHAHDARTLVAHADAALYQLKKAGISGYRIYGPEPRGLAVES